MTRPIAACILASLALVFAGCGKSLDSTATPGAAGIAAGTHDGWWCNEHGVPEEVCGLCSPKLAAHFKAKGDWCKEHDRPDSQCFTCHPELQASFAATYEARYGTKPPKPSDDGAGENQLEQAPKS